MNLEYYADTTNWNQPHGGGAENIFEPLEFWKELHCFNGYEKAVDLLEEIKKNEINT